ncbi:hypothetical protein J2W79_003168 [Methylorubrum extorquens]|nr:hypothetical protein [Methylorubrum extorquens]
MVLVPVTLLRQPFGHTFDGIFTASMTGGFGPVEHGTDALAHATGGFGLGQPNRRKDTQHVGGIDLIDAARPELRAGVLLQGVAPLLGVLGVGPGCPMLGVDEFDRFGERWDDHLRLSTLSERITAFPCELPIDQCTLTRFGQRHEACAAQTDVPTAALHDETQQPAFGA